MISRVSPEVDHDELAEAKREIARLRAIAREAATALTDLRLFPARRAYAEQLIDRIDVTS